GVSASDSVSSFTVSGSTSAGSSGSPASGTAPPPQGFTNATKIGSCYANIEARGCTYNAATRRYDLYISAAWDNGTHAHWSIEDNDGPKVYSKRFNHTEQMAGPGLKDVRIEVHNVNDTLLCYDSEPIYCGAGTAAGKDVDVLFDVKSVLPVSISKVRIIAVPYKDIDFAGIFVYTDSSIGLSDPRLEGNRSEAGLSGPVRVFSNGSYSLYTITTAMQAGRNISLTYNILPQNAGRYKFIVVANYSGKSDTFTKTVDISSCSNTNPVVAIDAKGNCKSFPTICDVPSNGWNTVERCTQPLEQPKSESPIGGAIAVLVIIIIIGVGYRYRDRIKERLKRRKDATEVRFDDETQG
ncbi:MAG TPA: hypothetical protein VJI12_00365, partial [archaeon]|nr:hypothetical protein [archaeon]